MLSRGERAKYHPRCHRTCQARCGRGCAGEGRAAEGDLAVIPADRGMWDNSGWRKQGMRLGKLGEGARWCSSQSTRACSSLFASLLSRCGFKSPAAIERFSGAIHRSRSPCLIPGLSSPASTPTTTMSELTARLAQPRVLIAASAATAALLTAGSILGGQAIRRRLRTRELKRQVEADLAGQEWADTSARGKVDSEGVAEGMDSGGVSSGTPVYGQAGAEKVWAKGEYDEELIREQVRSTVPCVASCRPLADAYRIHWAFSCRVIIHFSERKACGKSVIHTSSWYVTPGSAYRHGYLLCVGIHAISGRMRRGRKLVCPHATQKVLSPSRPPTPVPY